METRLKNNKTYWSLYDSNGKIQPFQMLITANSGHGKGLASEFIIEEWRKNTGGVVICLVDPKDENEFSFVQYKPKEPYHTERLKLDGMEAETHPCKIYHPFTTNIPKGFLPPVNFFTVPIKSMNKEDWSILAESSWDSESIKLMLRVAEDLGKNDGIFKFLHEIERMTKGQGSRKKPKSDPKNWRLHSGGGTAKSVAEIGNLLSPFKKDYFLRRETCDMKLNWKKILTDNTNYHLFTSMWLNEANRKKMKGFLALYLLNKIIENRRYLKKPILLVLPEVKAMCPANAQGYKYFLATSISEALVTIRSKGKGMSSISDTQVWSGTHRDITSGVNVSLFGNLNPEDQRIVVKACSYNRDDRDLLNSLDGKYCHFIRYKHEDENIFRIFMPRHMHKETHYNWIEMYKEHFKDKMVEYDDLIKKMKEEFESEDRDIEEMLDKKERIEKDEQRLIKDEKENKKIVKEKPKLVKENNGKESIMKMCYETFNDFNIDKKDKSYRAIARKIQSTFVDEKNFSHKTAKKYIEEYPSILKEKESTPKIDSVTEDISHMIGDGIMKEEINSLFG